MTGLHSNPLPAVAASVKSAKTFSPGSRSVTPASSARVRANAPQPRDARVGNRDSLGDFAEFIRSTGKFQSRYNESKANFYRGPVTSYEPVPLISTLPNRTVSTHKGANGSARNSSGSVPRVGTPTTLPKRSDSSAGRNRLQARDAAVPHGDSISDLIDFVRSGPQLDKGYHRIPRTVAPFRSTMDSDQMSFALNGKAVDVTLPDPRYSQASNSVNSSVTSQAPLLKSKPLPPQAHNEFEEEDMMPKRKTRRIRDPYAIDFSDDEDEFEAAMSSRPKPIQEESLADFLRNVPPPPEPVAPVLQETERPSSKGLKKKVSSPSFASRFGRTNSSATLQKQIKSSAQEQKPSVPKPYPAHTPIASQYSTTLSSYSQPQSRSAGNTATRPESTKSKVVRKSYQPREAIYTSSAGTSDLADFLLRSEPPSNTQTQPQTFLPTVQKEEASAFQRMFGRKKVH